MQAPIVDTIEDRDELLDAIAQVICRNQAQSNGHGYAVTFYQRQLALAIVERDAVSLEHILMTPDWAMRKAFEEVTGIRLHSTYKQAWKTLRAWGGLSDLWQDVRDAAWAANSQFEALALRSVTKPGMVDEVKLAYDLGFREIRMVNADYRLCKPGTNFYWERGDWARNVSQLRPWLRAYLRLRELQDSYQQSQKQEIAQEAA
jgi:hypothetical protein